MRHAFSARRMRHRGGRIRIPAFLAASRSTQSSILNAAQTVPTLGICLPPNAHELHCCFDAATQGVVCKISYAPPRTYDSLSRKWRSPWTEVRFLFFLFMICDGTSLSLSYQGLTTYSSNEKSFLNILLLAYSLPSKVVPLSLC